MRTEFFRNGQEDHKVQVYIELRDMWFGWFWPENAHYIILIPTVVIRIRRGD